MCTWLMVRHATVPPLATPSVLSTPLFYNGADLWPCRLSRSYCSSCSFLSCRKHLDSWYFHCCRLRRTYIETILQISKGRKEDALRVLQRLHKGEGEHFVQGEYQEIVDQIEAEKRELKPSWSEIARRSSWRKRMILACVIQYVI